MTTRKLLFTLFLIGCFFKSFAQPGTLDPSFNGTGISTFSFKKNISLEHVGASTADTSGNVYIVGTQIGDAALGTLPFIVKVLPSGKLDPTFGTKGKASIGFTPGTFIPQSVVLHPNGRIIIGGYVVGSPDVPCLVALTSNGSPDYGFAGSAYTEYSSYVTGTGSGSGFTALQVNKLGNIMASGSVSTAATDYDFIIAVVDQNGSPVNFAGNSTGVKTIDFASGLPDMATCSALDDTILYVAGNVNNSIAIAALGTASGNFITSFQPGGYEILTNSGADVKDSCAAIAVTADHGVVLAGSATVLSGKRSFFAYKIDATGAYLYSVSYSTPTSGQSKAYSLYLDQASNKLTLGGSVYDATAGKYSWALVHADAATGTQDNTLGVQNYNSITSSGFEGIINIHKLKDGNFILTGTYHDPADATDIRTKKVTPAGVAVTTYGSASEATFWIVDRSTYVTDLAKRGSDNKLWVGGNHRDASNNEVASIALMNTDGSIDTGFGGTSGADPGVLELTSVLPPAINNGLRLGSIASQNNDLIVSGTFADTNLFVVRIKSDGTLDNTFNGNSSYNYLLGGNGKGAYTHQVLIQPDNKILTYGYLAGKLTIGRYNSDGSTDIGFGGGSGYYAQDSSDIGDYDINNLQLALQADNKIVAVGAHIVPLTSAQEVLVFRLNTNGTRDYSFASTAPIPGLFTYNPGGSNGVQYASSVCINSKGKILVGGYIQGGGGKPLRTEASASSYNYLLLQVNPNGTLDSTFALNGAATPSFYNTQGILGLQLESDNAIVATGIGFSPSGAYLATALRFNAAGSLDATFNGQGHFAISNGYPKKALILGGSLYVLGGDNKIDNSPNGYVAKLKLGTGPVIKTTFLALPNYINKFYGDKPFNVKPVTNSPAPIQYSVVGSGCATIDAKTGLVTMICATVNPIPAVTIRVVQPAVNGYTADTAYTYLNIAKGIPTIVFSEQGGLVGEKFKLAFKTNYNDSNVTYFTQMNPFSSPSFNLTGNDSITVLQEGVATVTVYFTGAANYEDANATALIHGYNSYVAPVASDDAVTLTAGLDEGAVIQVLANDQAFSGQIAERKIDLDPSTPDQIDSIYVSPSLGLFYTDTLGAVHYVPFAGLIGSGSINYTIRDNHGLASAPAKISVSIKVLGEKPALKATELFTPNSDGLNDAFVIGHTDLDKTNILKVYDRNGQELFTLSNYKNDWGGDMPDGSKAENGIYYFLFREGDSGDQRELKGAVELRR